VIRFLDFRQYTFAQSSTCVYIYIVYGDKKSEGLSGLVGPTRRSQALT